MLKIDNFYTKPKLAEHLSQHKTLLWGTVRANSKGLPNDITKKNYQWDSPNILEKKTVAFHRVQGKKCQNKNVLLLSTFHRAEDIHNKDSKKQTNHKTSSNF